MSDRAQLAEIEQFLHREIPITQAMGVRVAHFGDGVLVMEAPLSLNHNHLGTAFGGSLGALATLAGYGLVWLELRDRSPHVVIKDSSIAFRRPVRKDIRAVCRCPGPAELSAFKDDFARKGKARISLNVTIEEDGLIAVDFRGTFVALR